MVTLLYHSIGVRRRSVECVCVFIFIINNNIQLFYNISYRYFYVWIIKKITSQRVMRLRGRRRRFTVWYIVETKRDTPPILRTTTGILSRFVTPFVRLVQKHIITVALFSSTRSLLARKSASRLSSSSLYCYQVTCICIIYNKIMYILLWWGRSPYRVSLYTAY